MTKKLGLVLLTHEKPAQTVRLVNTLDRMFDFPPIALHHDFSQTDLPTDAFRYNVAIVRPHLRTSWGTFSVVEATMRALELMYRSPAPPDWFVLLSGADFPIKPADRIVSDLGASNFDAHIHHERISYKNYERAWQERCFDRYCTLRLPYPSHSKGLGLKTQHIVLRHPLLTSYILPFSSELRCFAGGQWFSANRKAAEYILDFHARKPALARHYRRAVRFPEESYFQTILCNAPGLKISNDPRRYLDWSAGGRHPKTLGIEDLPKILESPAHFARKIDGETNVALVAELEKHLGL
jgi:hypothetical protein